MFLFYYHGYVTLTLQIMSISSLLSLFFLWDVAFITLVMLIQSNILFLLLMCSGN